MANQYINALTDLWNNAGTEYQGISLNVTNSASAADSKLLRLQVGSVDQFSVGKAGVVTAAGAITSGGAVLIASNDAGALGASGTAFSDLFLASGAVINLAAGNWVATHSSGILTVGTGDLRVTTAGTNAASAVTVGGTQTLTAKTLTSPVLTTPQINDTSADHQYIFGVSELAADRTVTLPLLLGNDTFVFADFIQTLTNKTFTTPTINTPTINTPTVTGLDASTTAKGLIEAAVASEFRANTAGILALTPAEVWTAAAEVTLTDAATIAVDMNTFINAVVTLAGNRAMGSPTNEKVGQCGCIRIVQDATGTRTLSYGTDWEFAGGIAPVLSTPANSQDLLFYQVLATNRIFGNLIKAVA